MRHVFLLSTFVLFSAAACAGAKPAPATTAATVLAPSASSAAASGDEDEGPATSLPSPSLGDAPPAVMPLLGLFDKTAKKSEFPKKIIADGDCWKATALGGTAENGYAAIAGKCGPPTGMKEFVTKASGKLDAKHPRDAYSVKMLGGFCYRFFAIGDESIGNLGIRVQTPKGALLSIGQSSRAAAILDPEEAWCKTHDRELTFVVEAPSGKGSYVFGVWARPK